MAFVGKHDDSSSTNSRRSYVWCYFEIIAEEKTCARCLTCQTKVSRGGNDVKNFTTTNLINHLTRHHPDLYERFLQQKKKESLSQPKTSESQLNKSKGQPDSNQTTLFDCAPWTNNHKETVKFNRLVAKMIAQDCQPYSIVDDAGFRELMKRALPRYAMPGK
jgi:hypothetical protein